MTRLYFCLPLLQFLLLLGCFALFWSLYYTLEVTLAHLSFRSLFCWPSKRGGHRAKRGRHGRGVEEEGRNEEDDEQDSGVEVLAVLDSEAKVPLIIGELLET